MKKLYGNGFSDQEKGYCLAVRVFCFFIGGINCIHRAAKGSAYVQSHHSFSKQDEVAKSPSWPEPIFLNSVSMRVSEGAVCRKSTFCEAVKIAFDEYIMGISTH